MPISNLHKRHFSFLKLECQSSGEFHLLPPFIYFVNGNLIIIVKSTPCSIMTKYQCRVVIGDFRFWLRPKFRFRFRIRFRAVLTTTGKLTQFWLQLRFRFRSRFRFRFRSITSVESQSWKHVVYSWKRPYYLCLHQYLN